MGKVLQNKQPQETQKFGVNGHLGIDIVGQVNQLDYIVAFEDGTVESVVDKFPRRDNTTKGMDTYGNYVLINHGNGFKTRYAHLKQGVSVTVGQAVKSGDTIGYMSDTGNSFGAHLHFEIIKDGKVIDPYDYIFNGKELFVKNETKTIYISKEIEKYPVYDVNGNFKDYILPKKFGGLSYPIAQETDDKFKVLIDTRDFGRVLIKLDTIIK